MRKVLMRLRLAHFLAAMVVLCFAGANNTALADPSCAGSCHIIKPYVDSLGNRSLLASAHAEAGLTCLDCHEQTDETRAYEQKIWDSGEFDDPLAPREYDADFCLRCHDSYEALAAQTQTFAEKYDKNPHESHLEEVDCYECHRVHKPSNFMCAGRHPANWVERLPPGWTAE